MAYEHKEGQGALFKNKKQNDRQPDYKGILVIRGTTLEIAAWEKTSQRGIAYFSLQVSVPNEYSHQQSSQSIHKEAFLVNDIIDGYFSSNNPDEDLPF